MFTGWRLIVKNVNSPPIDFWFQSYHNQNPTLLLLKRNWQADSEIPRELQGAKNSQSNLEKQKKLEDYTVKY